MKARFVHGGFDRQPRVGLQQAKHIGQTQAADITDRTEAQFPLKKLAHQAGRATHARGKIMDTKIFIETASVDELQANPQARILDRRQINLR